MNDESSPIARLRDYLGKSWEAEARPFYLLVDDQKRVRDAQGQAAHYGFSGLEPGQALTQQLLFLEGAELTLGKQLRLPILSLPNGRYAQVHAVRLKNGWGLAFSDATEQHSLRLHHQQTAHDLALAQRELEQRHQALQEAMQARERFIARMSHEFRTPLSSILGYADLAREDLDDKARLQHDIQAIARGANYLLSLVDNLLDHAVLEHGELSLHPSACDLQLLVQELEQLFQPAAAQKGLSLAWWIDGDIPARLWLDETRLRQILVNLIGNAIKFTKEGGITVTLEWRQGRLKVGVEDTGPGIAPEEQRQLFQPFGRGAGGGATSGAGLGLSICRELVERMEGEISLQSRRGEGTTVAFEIAAPERRAAGAARPDLRGRKVMLIEPDPDNRELLRLFLESAGARLSVPENQNQAFERFPSDLELAVVGLLQEPHHRLLLRRFKGAGYGGPVVAVGTQDDAQLQKKVLRDGYADLLVRPLRRSELIERLTAVV